MPSINLYRKRYGGKINRQRIPIRSLTATRGELHPNKIAGFRATTRNRKPAGVVKVEGKWYLVDGHHKTVANYLNGARTTDAEVLREANLRLRLILQRRDHGPLTKLVRRTDKKPQ